MKILNVSTDDGRYGAGRAAYRLHRGLRALGEDSRAFVMRKDSDDATVHKPAQVVDKLMAVMNPRIDSLPFIRRGRKPESLWSLNWFPNRFCSIIQRDVCDIVHLHWVGGGFLQLSALAKIRRPVVWTMHDMWNFTGGCHYSGPCNRYEGSCGACPQLYSSRENDLSRWTSKRKEKAYEDLGSPVFISPSRWLAATAANSGLLAGHRIEVIPNGMDTTIFRPLDRAFCREALGLPRDKKLLLFGAVDATSDRRKGFLVLAEALRGLASNGLPDLEVVIFGASGSADAADFGLRQHFLGILRDDVSLSLAYSAADAVVIPSLQENLSNVVLEAMACGAPCIAFDIGGMPDMILHRDTGYLAEAADAGDLARGISWVMKDEGLRTSLSRRSRQRVEGEFALEKIATRHMQLYREVAGA